MCVSCQVVEQEIVVQCCVVGFGGGAEGSIVVPMV